MSSPVVRAWGAPPGSALIRSCPEDFQVREQLGFELSGQGEHVFLHLQKARTEQHGPVATGIPAQWCGAA